MKFCGFCGAQIEDGAKFCPSCGQVNNAGPMAGMAGGTVMQPGAAAAYQGNKIAKMLKVVAIVLWALTVLISIFMIDDGWYDDIAIIAIMVGGFISGLMFYAFGEVISLLQQQLIAMEKLSEKEIM